jgi:hypothetical protein
MEELITLYPDIKEKQEGGHRYIYIPNLSINGKVMEGLLCLTERDGYPTRLFLAEPVENKLPWAVHQVLGRAWHTWSWNYVNGSLRPVEILAEHMRGLR